MDTEERGWTGAEAWIFLSIGDAGGGGEATLDRVIGAADSNNHAIPTPDEFSRAIGQLLGARLIRVSTDRYSLTASGKALFKRINSVHRGHIQRFIETADLWRTAAPIAAESVTWEVDQVTFRESWEQYHRWFEEWFQKHKKERNPDKGG